MEVTGAMLIGAASVRGTDAVIRALDPATHQPIAPDFAGGGAAEVDKACRLAEEAFVSYSRTSPEARARFLETIADNVMALGEALVERCRLETGLDRERILGEQARTAGQLRMFAGVVRRGLWRQVSIDSADHQRTPLPKPDLRLHNVPLGPVGVFGASNFPLLYSVAGGDTASALAAGCPVVVKAHFSHLGTSELIGRAIQGAVGSAGFHQGVFSLVIGEGNAIGEALVDHPLIQAVAFTGSQSGGMALVRRGQARPQPIPVFAEMTSVNPNVILPQALGMRGEAIARRFIEQMVRGVGQMCLKPGMILAVDGEGYAAMRQALQDAIATVPGMPMLNPSVHANFERGTAQLRQSAVVQSVGAGVPGRGPLAGNAAVFEVAAADLIADLRLADEVFGPVAMIVRCQDLAEMQHVLGRLNGQLSIAFHTEAEDIESVRSLLPLAERKTARILFNSFANLVEISDATIHGGPYPATSDSRFTSVGSTAIDRFLRPICYQGAPSALLPAPLQDENPYKLWRLRDGKPGMA